MEDITPLLLKKIDSAFVNEMLKSATARNIEKIVRDGNASYHQAYQYAKAIGNARAKAFKQVLSSSVLPDGKMYFNIADGIIRGTLPKDADSINGVVKVAQERINKRAKIGIKAQTADIDEDKLMGFINRISSESTFDEIAWILDDPVRQFCSAVVDSGIKKNAEFQSKIGIKAVVERSSNGGCCEYCDNLAGVYTYPDVDPIVFSRHDNCKCTIEYNAQKMSTSGHAFIG